MSDLWFGVSTAIWLGLVTAVSPCPLATNVAAVTYIGRQVSLPRRVMWSGLAYGCGRILAYAALGVSITATIVSATSVSSALQSVMAKLIGPLLVLSGMVLLELLPSPVFSAPFANTAQRFGGGGVVGAGILGFFCALAFCPVSAALFFGSLIPLAVEHQRPLVYPALYGVATAFPVVALGIGLALGANWAGRFLHCLPQIERIGRIVTGTIFILAGLYLTAKYVFAIL